MEVDHIRFLQFSLRLHPHTIIVTTNIDKFGQEKNVDKMRAWSRKRKSGEDNPALRLELSEALGIDIASVETSPHQLYLIWFTDDGPILVELDWD